MATAVAVAAMLLVRRHAPEGSVILTLGSVLFVATVVWVATFPVTVTI